MNFERHLSPKVAMGIGSLGKRGLTVDLPWVKGRVKQYHVKYFAWALDGWYRKNKLGISLFHFPISLGPNSDHFHPKYVITAVPGELTDYDSIYRKIEYTEILSKFLKLVDNNCEFRFWLMVNDEDMYHFLKLEEYEF